MKISKRNIKRFILVVLAAILTVSPALSLVSCTLFKRETPFVPDVVETFDTTHEVKVEETDKDMILNGKTDYVIVTSNNATTLEKKAVAQLNYFFYEATGITLPETSDTEISWDENTKVISLGDTALLESAGIIVDKSDLKNCGFYIKTVGNSIFIYGGDQNGVNYGVFELMSLLFNMDYYAADCYYIDRNITDLKLMDFDIKEVPDFKTRQAFSGLNLLSGDEYYLFATRQTQGSPYTGNSATSNPDGLVESTHNALYYIAPNAIDPESSDGKTYFETHRNWFSDQTKNGKPVNPCYSRDPIALADAVTEQIKVAILEQPNETMFMYGSMDVDQVCICDSCNAVRAQYGCNSASYIRVVNRIASNISAWWSSNEITDEQRNGRAEIKIGLLAYHEQQDAPVSYNKETGEYEAMSEEFVLEDNVFVQMALIESLRNVPYTAEQNQIEYEILQKWAVIATETGIWAYNALFQNYLVFADTFNAMQSDYQSLYKYGAQYMQDLGVFNVASATGFATLKVYLQGKLGWDITADYNAYIDKWFEGYFEEAAEPMRKYFDAMRAQTQFWIATDLITRGAEGNDYCTTELYGSEPGLINSFLAFFDEAYEAIEPLKTTDPEKYEMLYERILLESISPRYVQLTLYSSDLYMTTDQATQLRLQFKADCEKVGIDRFSEHVTISTLWSQWGIN